MTTKKGWTAEQFREDLKNDEDDDDSVLSERYYLSTLCYIAIEILDKLESLEAFTVPHEEKSDKETKKE